MLIKVKPYIVISSDDYTNVDGCESNQDLVFKVNPLGPRNLSISCKLVSLYGKTKLLGGRSRHILKLALTDEHGV